MRSFSSASISSKTLKKRKKEIGIQMRRIDGFIINSGICSWVTSKYPFIFFFGSLPLPYLFASHALRLIFHLTADLLLCVRLERWSRGFQQWKQREKEWSSDKDEEKVTDCQGEDISHAHPHVYAYSRSSGNGEAWLWSKLQGEYTSFHNRLNYERRTVYPSVPMF